MQNVIANTRYAALLSPADSSLTSFSNTWFTVTNAGSSSVIGRSLQFDDGNNQIWQKRKGQPLVLTSFDPTAILGSNGLSSSTVAIYSNFPTPANLEGVGLDLGRNLAAGVRINSLAADTLDL